MQIWVDADACPQVIKEILYRAAERARVLTTLVANTALRTPASDFIRTVRVPKGFDVADDRLDKLFCSGGEDLNTRTVGRSGAPSIAD